MQDIWFCFKLRSLSISLSSIVSVWSGDLTLGWQAVGVDCSRHNNTNVWGGGTFYCVLRK